LQSKQKINTRSSAEAELVSLDDIRAKMMWTKLFFEAQGYEVKENVVYRDNQSSMKLETNGKASSGKRTRHFNIRYFLITGLIALVEVSVQFCRSLMMAVIVDLAFLCISLSLGSSNIDRIA
jgi:hypothetical protein